MGLVFAIQPDLRKSDSTTLILKSTKKKFGLGGTLLFGAALLTTMYMAALPLFDLMWKEGNFWDKSIAFFLLLPIPLYPLMALGCFMYQEYIKVEKTPQGLQVESFEKLGPFKWNKHKAENLNLDDFKIENWKGALNQAALEAEKKGKEDRYATRGHWMLKVRRGNSTHEIVLERRARKEEIEDLWSQVQAFTETKTL